MEVLIWIKSATKSQAWLGCGLGALQTTEDLINKTVSSRHRAGRLLLLLTGLRWPDRLQGQSCA
jgi:hypothetical protein